MANCPYCNGSIDEELERFGGPCPHCFNEIHGDEAATDPRVEAQQAEHGRKRTRGLIIAALAVFTVGVAVSDVAVKASRQSAEVAEVLMYEEETEYFTMSSVELAAAAEAAKAPLPTWLWIASAAAAALVVAGLALARARRRARQEHIRAVATALVQACGESERAIQADQASGSWDQVRSETQRAVRKVLAKERRALKGRVDARVDGDFFKAALKASVGRHPAVGKPELVAEFDQLSAGVVAEVLRPRAVQKACSQALDRGLQGTRRRWTPRVRDPDALASSQILAGLPLDDMDLDARLLSALVDASALGGVVLSGMALSAGLPVRALELAGRVLTTELFQDLVLSFVFDQLVETVGEEVLEEVVTAIAAAFTGIGALFTLYKLGKWGWKLKKLLVDHEHLVALRAQVLDACLQEHDRRAAHILGTVTRELDQTPAMALARVRDLRASALEVA